MHAQDPVDFVDFVYFVRNPARNMKRHRRFAPSRPMLLQNRVTSVNPPLGSSHGHRAAPAVPSIAEA
jgi:hypothetical protein